MKHFLLLSFISIFLSACTSQSSLEHGALIQTYHQGHHQNLQDKKVVLVGGCFDLLHLGHVRFLQAAKQQGDYLIIALEPDSRIVKYKKRQPVHTQDQRAEILSQMRMVDEVILLPELKGFEDYLALVQTIHPQVIAATNGDPQWDNKKRQAHAVGALMITVVDRLEPFSSSGILKNHGLKKGDHDVP